jgi:hypothetical protein
MADGKYRKTYVAGSVDQENTVCGKCIIWVLGYCSIPLLVNVLWFISQVMDLYMCCLQKVTYHLFTLFICISVTTHKTLQALVHVIRLWVRYQTEERNVSQLSFPHNEKSLLELSTKRKLTLCRLMSYIYMLYRTANLHMLHFKYLFNKCPY